MLENVEKIIKTPFRAFSMNFTFDSLYQSMSSNLALITYFNTITHPSRNHAPLMTNRAPLTRTTHP